ncbi:hypothetical protein P2H44_06445 [Albimonas sp. CAU 1670]|uniref:hypothetical protein n=1 Tax=Albimonas sp. CAU 1670 TaxID=3032599 RepID=UPI0023DA61B7|nr:hypothetical protein [Albimonas sp. CAU 1670]MDF2232189.1 hypothetical protein [Albimonas sp. CAU 1670]
MTAASPEIASIIVWAAGVSNLVALGTTVWNIVSSGARTNAKTLEEHARRLDLVEREIELVKAKLDRGPTPEAMQQIFVTLARMEGQMEVFNERLMPVKAIAERLQEQALSEGKR